LERDEIETIEKIRKKKNSTDEKKAEKRKTKENIRARAE
jgi:hypothetical protein